MKYYLAPLEGITNRYYRNLHAKYFKGVDKYYIPFISPIEGKLSAKDLKEVDRNNNQIKVVPQIISKNAKDTIEVINYLVSLGYDEINLNFGCPSPTVVTKGKGSGILKDLDYLDSYLNMIFSNVTCKISIKTRLGLNDAKEFKEILKIYNKYPIYELIIHPRVQSDLYSKPINYDILPYILDNTSLDIIYNGEIKNIDDINRITSTYPSIKGIMIGRGLITSPNMLDDNKSVDTIKEFYNNLKDTYLKEYGWNNTKYYVKEIWSLMIDYFDVDNKTKKTLFKANTESEFNNIVNNILNTK